MPQPPAAQADDHGGLHGHRIHTIKRQSPKSGKSQRIQAAPIQGFQSSVSDVISCVPVVAFCYIHE
jgi:hypothetical protein